MLTFLRHQSEFACSQSSIAEQRLLWLVNAPAPTAAETAAPEEKKKSDNLLKFGMRSKFPKIDQITSIARTGILAAVPMLYPLASVTAEMAGQMVRQEQLSIRKAIYNTFPLKSAAHGVYNTVKLALTLPVDAARNTAALGERVVRPTIGGTLSVLKSAKETYNEKVLGVDKNTSILVGTPMTLLGNTVSGVRYLAQNYPIRTTLAAATLASVVSTYGIAAVPAVLADAFLKLGNAIVAVPELLINSTAPSWVPQSVINGVGLIRKAFGY